MDPKDVECKLNPTSVQVEEYKPGLICCGNTDSLSFTQLTPTFSCLDTIQRQIPELKIKDWKDLCIKYPGCRIFLNPTAKAKIGQNENIEEGMDERTASLDYLLVGYAFFEYFLMEQTPLNLLLLLQTKLKSSSGKFISDIHNETTDFFNYFTLDLIPEKIQIHINELFDILIQLKQSIPSSRTFENFQNAVYKSNNLKTSIIALTRTALAANIYLTQNKSTKDLLTDPNISFKSEYIQELAAVICRYINRISPDEGGNLTIHKGRGNGSIFKHKMVILLPSASDCRVGLLLYGKSESKKINSDIFSMNLLRDPFYSRSIKLFPQTIQEYFGKKESNWREMLDFLLDLENRVHRRFGPAPVVMAPVAHVGPMPPHMGIIPRIPGTTNAAPQDTQAPIAMTGGNTHAPQNTTQEESKRKLREEEEHKAEIMAQNAQNTLNIQNAQNTQNIRMRSVVPPNPQSANLFSFGFGVRGGPLPRNVQDIRPNIGANAPPMGIGIHPVIPNNAQKVCQICHESNEQILPRLKNCEASCSLFMCVNCIVQRVNNGPGLKALCPSCMNEIVEDDIAYLHHHSMYKIEKSFYIPAPIDIGKQCNICGQKYTESNPLKQLHCKHYTCLNCLKKKIGNAEEGELGLRDINCVECGEEIDFVILNTIDPEVIGKICRRDAIK